MVIPESQIENIEVKKYDLQTDSGDELTPEEMRRKKSEEFFKKAQMEFDRMNVARGIELLEKAVEADPLFEKGLERLIIHLVKRNEYQKAHKYIEELSKIKPLPPEFEEIKKKVSEVIDKEREKQKRDKIFNTGHSELTRQLGKFSEYGIPEAPPARDFSGFYYIEYSYYAQIQQKEDIASIGLYSSDSSAPLLQIPASVKGNFIILDLSRIQSSAGPESVFAVMHPENGAYSLNYYGDVMPYLGKKMETDEEKKGFQALIANNPEEAAKHFKKALVLTSGNPHCLFGLGRAQMLSGQPEPALETFRRIPDHPEFVKFFFMEKFLKISMDYSQGLMMSRKDHNAIDDYQKAISEFPLFARDFAPFTGVLERGDMMTDYLANLAEMKIFGAYQDSLDVVKEAHKKSYCHWPYDGSLTSTAEPDRGKYITLAKLMLLKGKAAGFRNNFDDSFLWKRRALCMGIHMNHGRLETRKLGIDIEKMGIEAFRELISSSNTPDQVEEILNFVQEVIENHPSYDYQSLVSYERVEWPTVTKSLYTQAALKTRIDLARLPMLPLAAASKKYYLENNRQWPVSTKMLAPDYLKEIPPDPFGTEDLKVFVIQRQGFRIYSIGPDRIDDKGYSVYNPASGVNGGGDIVMDIR